MLRDPVQHDQRSAIMVCSAHMNGRVGRDGPYAFGGHPCKVPFVQVTERELVNAGEPVNRNGNFSELHERIRPSDQRVELPIFAL